MEPVYVSIQMELTGKRIRELLKKNGYTVRDVQGAMGFTSPQAVYKWLYGQSLPSVDNLVVLSKILHTSIDSILVVDGDFVLSECRLWFCSLRKMDEYYEISILQGKILYPDVETSDHAIKAVFL